MCLCHEREFLPARPMLGVQHGLRLPHARTHHEPYREPPDHRADEEPREDHGVVSQFQAARRATPSPPLDKIAVITGRASYSSVPCYAPTIQATFRLLSWRRV